MRSNARLKNDPKNKIWSHANGIVGCMKLSFSKLYLSHGIVPLTLRKAMLRCCREDRVVVMKDRIDDKEFQFNPVF